MKMIKIFVVGFIFLSFALPAQAQDLFDFFDLEGNNPFRAPGVYEFSALESKFLTAQGHGWRNEVKKKKDLRASMYGTSETLESQVKVCLSPGAKTIILQYHDDKSSTLVKILVADIHHKKLLNGIPSDGIFDVYAMFVDEDNVERTVPFMALKSGEGFSLKMVQNQGRLHIQINEKVLNTKTLDCAEVYLKFGSYLQAQDPLTGRQEQDRSRFGPFYLGQGILEDRVVFSKLRYTSGGGTVKGSD